MNNYNMNELRYNLLNFFYRGRPNTVSTLNFNYPDREMVIAEANYLVDKGYIRRVNVNNLSGDIFGTITAKGIDSYEDSSFHRNFNKYISNVSNMEYEINQNIISVRINEALYSHIKCYLDTGDYYHAIEESYKKVRTILKTKLGSEKATDAFNKQNCNKILGCEYEQGSINGDLYDAIKYLHMSVQFFRNVYSHQEAHDIDKNYALQSISLASLALDLLGGAR